MGRYGLVAARRDRELAGLRLRPDLGCRRRDGRLIVGRDRELGLLRLDRGLAPPRSECGLAPSRRHDGLVVRKREHALAASRRKSVVTLPGRSRRLALSGCGRGLTLSPEHRDMDDLYGRRRAGGADVILICSQRGLTPRHQPAIRLQPRRAIRRASFSLALLDRGRRGCRAAVAPPAIEDHLDVVIALESLREMAVEAELVIGNDEEKTRRGDRLFARVELARECSVVARRFRRPVAIAMAAVFTRSRNRQSWLASPSGCATGSTRPPKLSRTLSTHRQGKGGSAAGPRKFGTAHPGPPGRRSTRSSVPAWRWSVKRTRVHSRQP